IVMGAPAFSRAPVRGKPDPRDKSRLAARHVSTLDCADAPVGIASATAMQAANRSRPSSIIYRFHRASRHRLAHANRELQLLNGAAVVPGGRASARSLPLRPNEEDEMIDLYYWTTPNGHKITIFLEETGLAYRIVPINIGKGEQFKADFLAVSPNNRIPAMVDHAPADGGKPVPIFE